MFTNGVTTWPLLMIGMAKIMSVMFGEYTMTLMNTAALQRRPLSTGIDTVLPATSGVVLAR